MAPKFEMSEEDMALLSEEEKQAIEDANNFNEEDDGESDKGSDGIGEDDDEVSGKEEKPPEVAATDNTENVDEKDSEQKANESTAVKPEEQAESATKSGVSSAPSFIEYTPKYNIEKVNEALTAIATDITKLKEDHNSGDLSVDEYVDKLNELKDKQYELKGYLSEEQHRKEQVDIINRAQATSYQKTWQAEQDLFFSEYPVLKENKILHGAMISAVDEIGEKFKGKSGITLLMAAKREVEAALGISISAKTVNKNDKSQPLLTGKPKGKEPVIPTNLSQMPSSDIDRPGSGRFPVVDKLLSSKKGIDLEKQLSRMSEEEKEAWLMEGTA